VDDLFLAINSNICSTFLKGNSAFNPIKEAKDHKHGFYRAKKNLGFNANDVDNATAEEAMGMFF